MHGISLASLLCFDHTRAKACPIQQLHLEHTRAKACSMQKVHLENTHLNACVIQHAHMMTSKSCNVKAYGSFCVVDLSRLASSIHKCIRASAMQSVTITRWLVTEFYSTLAYMPCHAGHSSREAAEASRPSSSQSWRSPSLSKGESLAVLLHPPLLLTSASNACALHMLPCALIAAIHM